MNSVFIRLSRVSRLWWQVSTNSALWHTLDLGPGRVNEKHKTERMLFWMLENRLSRVQDLALGSNNKINPISIFKKKKID